MAEWNVSTEAARLHKDADVWGMMLPWGYQGDLTNKHSMVEDAAAHGYTLASLTVSVDWHGLDGAIKAIAGERAYFLANPDKFVLVDRFADIVAAKRDGKLAVVFHFQGTNPVENDLNMVETFYRAPLRIRDLTEDDWLNGLLPSAAMLASGFPGVSRAPIELFPLQDRAQAISYSEYCHTAAARRFSWTRRRML